LPANLGSGSAAADNGISVSSPVGGDSAPPGSNDDDDDDDDANSSHSNVEIKMEPAT
jgi:hypothetical protein